jgi:hypothetical protein
VRFAHASLLGDMGVQLAGLEQRLHGLLSLSDKPLVGLISR